MGGKKHRLYYIWASMKSRCSDPMNRAYKCYGGRGIEVCEEWKKDFYCFYKWAVAHGSAKGLSIDRIDNNGNYEPSNCRFVNRVTQGNNRRDNVFLTVSGISLTISKWSVRTGINVNAIRARLRYGWDASKAVSIPLRVYKT